MNLTYDGIMESIVGLLATISADWEYSGTITAETDLLRDLEFESLELVVLGVSIQELYEDRIPFPEFLAELGEREVKEMYVGELVEFVYRSVGTATVGEKR